MVEKRRDGKSIRRRDKKTLSYQINSERRFICEQK